MRPDAQGIFWHDVERERGRYRIARVMPEIPPTTWTKLRDLPNLSRASVLGIDLETCDPSIEKNLGPGWARGEGYIAGVSISADDDGQWYFPIRHTIEPENNYDPQKVLAWLGDSLPRTDKSNIGANLIYDYGWLRQEGVAIGGALYDVQFAEALLDSDAYVSLETLSQKYLGESKQGDICFQWCADYYGGPPTPYQRKNLYRTPGRLVAPYAIGDVDLPKRILEKQWPLLKREGLLDLFIMECELIPLYVAMRFAGVSIDVKRAEQVRDYLVIKEAGLQAQIDSAAGGKVNTNSSAELAKLFDRLKIPYGFTEPTTRNPEGQPSFTKEFMQTVSHPIAKVIQETKKVNKTRSTFIESYFIKSHLNGKIYPLIHPLKGEGGGAVTGRHSMSNPNGQNFTSKDEEMTPLVRGCVVPDNGHKQWRDFDWNQLQYRFLAHYATGDGADNLRHIFNTDPKADYHATVQELIRLVTGTLHDRKPVKNINFGFVFGMGIEHLAEVLGLSIDKATELAEEYHLGVPYVKATLKAAAQEAELLGYVTTILGRKPRFNLFGPARWSKNSNQLPALPYEQAVQAYGRVKRAHTHKALNFKLQGSEGDLMKHCLLRAWKEGVFAATGVPRLVVHDSQGFSDHGESDDAFDYLHHDIMERSLKFRVPITVKCKVGATWADCG